MRRRLFALPLALSATLLAQARSDTARPATAFHINGIAVSSRDGVPIPFCRLRVVAAPDGNLTQGVQSFRYDLLQLADFRSDTYRSHRSDAAPVPDDAISADAHGRFSINVPRAGAWQLTGTARGYRTQSFDAHDGYFSAIVVSDTAPAATVTLRLAPNAEVSGVVFDEAGEPVASAQVHAEDAAGTSKALSAFALTDDRGHYELPGLAPGSYRISVEARPWYAAGGAAGSARFLPATPAPPASALDPSLDVVYPTTWFPGTDDRQAADVVTLSGGEDRQADFHLLAQPAARLSVPRVENTSQQDDRRGWSGPVVVRVSDGGFPAPAGTMSATSGSWEVGGLAPGTYEVRLPGSAGSSGEVREFSVKAGAAVDLSSAQSLVRVQVHFAGNAGRRPQVTLTDTTSGARFTSGGGGRPGFGDFGSQSERGPSGGRGASGRGRDDASTAVSIPPGNYRVSVVTGDDSYLASLTAEGVQANGLTVQVTEGSPVLTLNMAAGRAQISGMVRLGDAPSTGAMVLLVPAAADMAGIAGRTLQTESNTDGSFTLPAVVPGLYILVVLDHGWSVNWRDPGTLAGYLEHGLPLDLKPSAKQKLDVVAIRP